MAATDAGPRPTHAEFDILQVLWHRGPSTVREVHQSLTSDRQVGYTTVLKLLQIMAEKGLVTRDESTRSHVYRAAASEDATTRRMVSDLLDRAFEGSALRLVMQALAARPASRADLQRIRALLDQKEKKKGESS